MKLKKVELINSMKKCLPGVETGASIIEGADTFVFADNVIHSYNDSISVSAPLTISGLSGCVKSAEFFKLISKLPDEEIDINPTTDSWGITSGKMIAEIALIKNKITEYVGTLNILSLQWTGLPANFLEGLKLCKISGNRSIHRGIFVNKNLMLSTDLQRLNYFTLAADMGLFWIDDPAVDELMKFPALVSFAISPAWVHFKTADGAVFSCKRKEDSTYPMQRILQVQEMHTKDDSCIEGILPPLLGAVVDRVSTLSKDISGWSAVKLTFNQSQLEVFSERTAGKIKEMIPFTKPLTKPISLSIWIDAEFIKDAAEKVPEFYIKSVPIGNTGKNRTDFIFHNAYYQQIMSTIEE